MQRSNLFLLGIGVVIALLVVGLVFVLRSHTPATPSVTVSTTTEATGSTTTTNLGGGVSVTLPAGAIIAIAQNVPPPSLAGSIQISSSLPSDAQAVLRTQEQTLIAELKQSPTRVDLWLELGVDRKINGDYQGAIDAWQYVAEAGPSTISYIAYGDLGDLYENFLNNYPQAETNYLEAIKINPQDIGIYGDLYTLYRYQYKTNTNDAAAIVAQGLQANPGNPDLLQLQQQLQTGQ